MTDSQAAQALLNECSYEPIGDYAIIGNCRTGALVSRRGSIDWLCLPHFSGPSVFAALLDRRRGGRFLVRPQAIGQVSRRYLGASPVLETLFQCSQGVLRLTDFMPKSLGDTCPLQVARLVECLAGEVRVDAIWQPRPGYGLERPRLQPQGEFGWAYRDAEGMGVLLADTPLQAAGDASLAAGTFRLEAGQACRFVFAYAEAPGEAAADLAAVPGDLDATLAWWRDWCAQCHYQGPYAEAVIRSCLTLKLLAYQTSGAVLAALTASLPESLSAGRNWDYRYCWLRDTSLLLQSFVDLGFRQESEAFLDWLLHVDCEPYLQPLYGLNGQPAPDERILPHLEGYRGRGPVRIGNAARRQLQLDIYGEVMQTAYRYVTRGGQLREREKQWLASLGQSVIRLWRQPDQSIWEPRAAPRHYTYSKLMCWVALDRLLALADCVPMAVDKAPLARERDLIRAEIDSRGFDRRLGAYVGYFGGSDPDASLLLMARYRYVPPGDPRMQGTFQHIMERLAVDGLIYRYPPGEAYDGVEGRENLFAVCSFWAVDYLARAGRVDPAIRLFERLLGLANDVGLYAEQFDADSHQALGNFPQAFSHSGLVTAALAIDQALRGRPGPQIAT